MRKKKLLSRISELESEIYILKLKNDYWKEMVERFTKGLHENGVEAEIVFPEPEMINCASLEEEDKYIPGISNEPPELRFDFTEHDEAIKKGVAYETN